jgi:hypothetical protein
MAQTQQQIERMRNMLEVMQVMSDLIPHFPTVLDEPRIYLSTAQTDICLLPTIGRDREGRGHILVLKIKVPARFNQLLRDGSIPNQLLCDGSFCRNTWL